MRVLFCTDGSKISYNALENFAHFAAKGTIVDVICVIDWSFLPDETIIEEAGFVNNCRNIADTILDYAEKKITETYLIFGEKIKQCGSVVESILEQLETKNYDAVILGSHGKKGIQIWLGSVSREILDSGNISTYISKAPNNGQKILFTTDGTEISLKTIEKAAQIFELYDKEIYLCTAVENPDFMFPEGTLDTNWLMSIKSQLELNSDRALKAAIDFFDNKGIKVKQSRILEGTPAQKIIDYAKEEGIDLIVLGSKTKMQKFLRDSVSRRAAENAKCDAIIIRG